jgi:PDZ domain-containing protein
MLKLLKHYQKLIIVLIFPYLYLMMVLVVPTSYSVTAPGNLTPVEQFIQIEGVDPVGDFNTIYVYSYDPITAFQYFMLFNNQTMDVYLTTDREKDMSLSDEYQAGQLSKLVSMKTSLIIAYELAMAKDPSITIDYAYRGLYVYMRPSRMSDLKIGDEVVSIDGESYTEHTHDTFMGLTTRDQYTLTVKRTAGDQVTYHTIDYVRQEGELSVRFLRNDEILSAQPQFQLPGKNNVVGGPSGGMMQTLSLYASLMKLNIEGVKIAGTGTIQMGGTIGPIGGIRQKIYTANYQKVDIFFIPAVHQQAISGIEFNFELVVVATIEEAVNWLHENFN